MIAANGPSHHFNLSFHLAWLATTPSATWSSHAAAVAAVKAGEADGVGFALTGTDIAAIDLDHCRDPATGEIELWAQAIIDQTDGPTSRPQFQAQAFALSAWALAKKRTQNYKVEGRNGAKIEIYRQAVRYITISALEIGHCAALSNIDSQIDNLIAQYKGSHWA